ncbi:hypothetical protein RSO41_06105 [Halomonas sp. I1]|nr:hypothetical protein [Halomonas sp. I1]MDT8894223.1 hypothetical protein [Halomonas sp. I1]
MEDELTPTEKLVIDQFLAGSWSAFQSHCVDHGVDADEIAEKLSDDD